jgi:hypothetical protein
MSSHSAVKSEAARSRLPVCIALAGALSAGSAAALFAFLSLSITPELGNTVNARALRCWSQMQSGVIDRTELSEDYSAHLSDDAVLEMSNYLKEHKYGVPPSRVEVLQKHQTRNQTIYLVKLDFPRGDAASLLLGFDNDAKITGVTILSMAGD